MCVVPGCDTGVCCVLFQGVILVYVVLFQGVILVYDVSSKLSFDLVVSLRQKVAIRNNHVSYY